MGRIRQTFIKRAGEDLVEKYEDRLTTDFETNKKVIDEVAEIATKRLRNRVAGYVTKKMKKVDA
ncbi:30S ribosomal protein S17e [Methanococcus aeolicus]|uniref:Small ribosomal subunit protein eS17 n=1 Tax=Methanococcus aeolicus (strain ATCC BAA-1280 / DSM 17508 / OCM 812 / Nankai-3) TaxID=419665 RepID=RS17E_META3|nr:30S ribosomal protein S17e [Methanococcus aeolicus]A6UVG8.1 RecName: Full=Small ribosomal subunit protein eS17; AltName: Full=30S ribosomal protein S17e [Methanococcus aeolicus Nankai-3]ABR56490.1 30S ribosomal protein S17E [Methanococcus aeolicus Nankai-3]UXM84493.1 30S ribosomal protein S17e [Methanococcus aeolicus]